MPQAVKIEAVCNIKESDLYISREYSWTQKLRGLWRSEEGKRGKGLFGGIESHEWLVTVFQIYLKSKGSFQCDTGKITLTLEISLIFGTLALIFYY